MKILILGVGPAQRDAIRYLKDRHHTVYALSYQAEPVGGALPDHFAVVDIKNKQAVEQYVRSHGIELVYSVGSEVAMPTVGHVSQRCGLPGFVSESQAHTMGMKPAFRRFQDSHALASVRYRILTAPEQARGWALFPAVVKPVDSQGQRGVYRITSLDDLEAAFPSSAACSAAGRVILEEYVGGEEMSANMYVVDGRMQYCFLSLRIAEMGTPFGAVRGHVLPAEVEPSVRLPLEKRMQDVVQHLGIHNGPVYAQFKLLRGDIFIIELTPRLDGCHLWRAIRFCGGVDLLDITFRHLMGDRPGAEAFLEACPRKLVRVEYFFQKPEEEFSSFRHCINPASLYHEFYYDQGRRVSPVNGVLEKVGYQILSGGA